MDADELTAFRAATRVWLEQNCPPAMRSPRRSEDEICWGGRRWRFHSDDQHRWLTRMAGRGWTVPEWPSAYGVGGLDPARGRILGEELARLNAREPLLNFGTLMLGPALLRYGSEMQKQQHLPPIVRGEIRWCQGYSEPEAGSDLASLTTRAEDLGDHYVVNGEKLWTSHADQSDWIFCLVRTEPDAPKHRGISFLLIDMASPGITVRPIALISGRSPFCATRFDEVVVPKANRVGAPGQGWEIAKYLLSHERRSAGAESNPFHGRRLLGAHLATERGGAAPLNAPLRAAIAQADIDLLAFSALLDATPATAPDAYASVIKYCGTELNKRCRSLQLEAAGSDALRWHDEDGLARHWLRSKANSIEGGTSEIQLNIISKQLLHLPAG